MTKRRFSHAQRYAVWSVHERRCWLCREVLPFEDATIDHVIPEAMLDRPDDLTQLLVQYGLPPRFDVDSYENWLPCHMRCNQTKGASTLEFVPGLKRVFDGLIRKSPDAKRAELLIRQQAKNGEAIAILLTALDQSEIPLELARGLITALKAFPDFSTPDVFTSQDFIKIDTGYWIRQSEIRAEGVCRCERQACVGSDRKVYCVFPESLSDWVIGTGLYWKCYDELVVCPRCTCRHKRGYIGREGSCGWPYSDQAAQHD